MQFEIRVRHRFDEIDAREWDRLVETADAPAFYSSDFLRAYERSPLQPFHDVFYIEVRERAGNRLVAALPAYLQAIDDPGRDVSSIVTASDTGSGHILMTHVVHCYDSRLPAVELGTEVVDRVVAALADLASQTRAERFGFLHVEADTALAKLLEKTDLRAVSMETRFNREMSGCTDIEDYISAMPSYNARRNLRRCRRRADRLGIATVAADGRADHLAAAVELCHLTAERHGTPDYYPRAEMAGFLASLGAAVRVISVWSRDLLIATAICLGDGRRYHFWASGVRPGEYGLTSPFNLLFYEAVRETLERGIPVFEGGRGNPTFKHRHGLRPVPTLGFVERP